MTAALVASVTCMCLPRASTRPTCRPCRSTVRRHGPGRRVGRAAIGPSSPTGWGRRARPARGARGRRRRFADPASRARGRSVSPVARSHTIVEPRWLEMPTASTGPSSSSAARARSRQVSASSLASNSTRPSAGESGSSSRSWPAANEPSSSHDGGAHAARADVDDEDPPVCGAHVTARRRRRTVPRARACRG